MKGQASTVPSWNLKMICLSECASGDVMTPSDVPHTTQFLNWSDSHDGHNWTRQELLQPAAYLVKGRQRKPQNVTRGCVSRLGMNDSHHVREGAESDRAGPTASGSHNSETAPSTFHHVRRSESTDGFNLKVLAYTATVVAASASTIILAFILAHPR
jgi:hypothetical protein